MQPWQLNLLINCFSQFSVIRIQMSSCLSGHVLLFLNNKMGVLISSLSLLVEIYLQIPDARHATIKMI